MGTSDVPFCWMTAQADGIEHAVTDPAQVAGMEAGHGWFEAMCGREFLAACMDVGPLAQCSSCRAFLRARAEMRSLDERVNRPGWLSRLFGHHKHPADVGSEPTTIPNAPASAGTKPSADADGAPEPTPTSESGSADAAHRHGRHAA